MKQKCMRWKTDLIISTMNEDAVQTIFTTS